MRLKPSRAHLVYSGIFLVTLVVLTSFQNCGSQDYENTLLMPTGSKVDASHQDKIPFAFDFQANQITYMSCSRSNDKSSTNVPASTTHLNNLNTFFTFKVGAYDEAGLTLRPEFIDYVTENFTFKGTLSDTEIRDAFTYATEHGGTALQLAIRNSTPIASQIQFIGNENNGPIRGISYELFPQNSLLTTTEFLPQLVALFKNPSTRINALGASSLQSYRLEAALHEESLSEYNELTAALVRSKLQSSSGLPTLLSVTYSQNLTNPENINSSYIARSANSTVSDNRVWGSGFKLNFSAPSNFGRSQKNNVMSSVQEYDLSTFEPKATWTCPQFRRYIIVSPKDRGTGGAYPCNDVPDSSITDPQKVADLKIIRRHLPASEWIVDLTRQCVSPRSDTLDCYGSRGFKPVDYSRNGIACGLDSTNQYLDRICAEFVSICLRQ